MHVSLVHKVVDEIERERKIPVGANIIFIAISLAAQASARQKSKSAITSQS